MSSVADESLEEAWTLVEEGWEDDGAHKRFIALCDAVGRLDEAGARYRAVQESDEKRAPEAKRRIDQIVVRALATLQAQRLDPPDRPRRTLFWVAVFVFLAICLTTMWMIRDL